MPTLNLVVYDQNHVFILLQQHSLSPGAGNPKFPSPAALQYLKHCPSPAGTIVNRPKSFNLSASSPLFLPSARQIESSLRLQWARPTDITSINAVKTPILKFIFPSYEKDSRRLLCYTSATKTNSRMSDDGEHRADQQSSHRMAMLSIERTASQISLNDVLLLNSLGPKLSACRCGLNHWTTHGSSIGSSRIGNLSDNRPSDNVARNFQDRRDLP